MAHFFTNLPMTEAGFTDIDTMVDSVFYQSATVVYVATDGDDDTGAAMDIDDAEIGADPFNPTGTITPFETVAAALAAMPDNEASLLLFRAGQTWTGGIGSIGKSGASQSGRLIVGRYGAGARPTFNCGTDGGINIGGNDYILVTGLRFYGHLWETDDAGRGANLQSTSDDVLFEDCVFERMHQTRVQGSSASNRHNRIAFRRCLFMESRVGSLDSHIYATNTLGLLIEENYFYSPVTKSRHLYLSPSGNEDNSTLRSVCVRGNVFFDSERTGLSIRCGGLITNNLIVRNDVAYVGGKGGSDASLQTADVTNNVFIESCIGTGDGGQSLSLASLEGGEATGNIWTDPSGLTTSSAAISLVDNGAAYFGNFTIANNIVYNWAGSSSNRGLTTSSNFDVVENVSITGNHFQFQAATEITEIVQHRSYNSGAERFAGYTYEDNRYQAPAPESGWFSDGDLAAWVAASGETGSQAGAITYTDPTRNLKTYNDDVLEGDADTDDLMLAMLDQSRESWETALTAYEINDYIRTGFDVTTLGVPDYETDVLDIDNEPVPEPETVLGSMQLGESCVAVFGQEAE